MNNHNSKRTQIILLILMTGISIGIISFGISLVMRTLPAMQPTPVPTLGNLRTASAEDTIPTISPTVSDNYPPPTIYQFSVIPDDINEDSCFQISWDVQENATIIRVSRGVDIILESDLHQNIIEDCPLMTGPIEYHIQAINDYGETARHQEVSISPFTPTPSSPLIQEWELLFYLGEDYAYYSLITGTKISAQFQEFNKLTGFSGCNNYEAFYSSQDNLVISPPKSTKMDCPVPNGVMEQEDTFLKVLLSTTSYNIDKDRLELYNAGGEKILVFSVCKTEVCP